MMKKFDTSFSKKFPDGSFVSMSFGTHLDEDTSDEDVLFNRAKESTERDIKNACNSTPLIKSIVENIENQLVLEERVNTAKKVMDKKEEKVKKAKASLGDYE